MNQSCACSLFFAKTNEKDACFRVPQSPSLPQSCAKEKSSGVEIEPKCSLVVVTSCTCAVALPLSKFILGMTTCLKNQPFSLKGKCCALKGGRNTMTRLAGSTRAYEIFHWHLDA